VISGMHTKAVVETKMAPSIPKELLKRIQSKLDDYHMLVMHDIEELFLNFEAAADSDCIQQAEGNEVLSQPTDGAMHEASVSEREEELHPDHLDIEGHLESIEQFVLEQNHMSKLILPMNAITKLSQVAQEPERTGLLGKCVHSKAFEIVVFLVILAQTCYVIYDVDWQMKNTRTRSGVWNTIEICFLSLYSLEMLLKLAVHRMYIFYNSDARWNIFDFVLVGASFLDVVFSAKLAMTPQILRAVRILRVSRVLRVVHVLTFFSELRLMLHCVMWSLGSLLWSLILILGFSLIFAIALVQQMSGYMIDMQSQIGLKEKETVHKKFGSVAKTLLTLCKSITGGEDWGDNYEQLAKAGGFASALFVAYILLVWLSVTNIVTSMFVDKAMKLAAPTREERMLERSLEELAIAEELTKAFDLMDTNQTSILSMVDFQEGLKLWQLRNFFELHNLRISDAQTFFLLLAARSENKEVDKATFVSGCLKMKGFASHFDMIAIQQQMWVLGQTLQRHVCKCEHSLDVLGAKLENHDEYRAAVRSRRPHIESHNELNHDELDHDGCSGNDLMLHL